MYLNKYHYLSISRSGDQNVKQAIETFQDFFHLNVTGMLNDETIAAMKKPRCGNPDVDKQTGRYKRYSIPGWNRWHFKDMSYYLQPGSNMDEVTQRRIIKQAFDMWARYTGFTFEPADIPENADIKISFGKYTHKVTRAEDECKTAFDGWGGVLAHAFHPQDRRLHFDDSESFTNGDGFMTIDLLELAAHEIGHTLGLGHSKETESIMYPEYQGNSPVRLFRDDVDGIQAKYRKPATPTDVEYVLGNNGDNCEDTCLRKDKNCAATGHNFQPEGALDVLTSLGIKCRRGGTEDYEYLDNPGYMVSGGWAGQCIGYLNIPDVIDCTAGGNPDFKRLCPCIKPYKSFG